MILIILSSFILLSFILILMQFYELRLQIQNFLLACVQQSKKQLIAMRKFIHQFKLAGSPEYLQSHWHLQQWWILIAGCVLFMSILIFSLTRPVTASVSEARYLKKVDPQIYALLEGQILTPPEEVDEGLILQALQEDDDTHQPVISAQSFNPNIQDVHLSYHQNLNQADRKWHKMNPRFKQRLLMVFKLMQEQHGYELVLLEGYRSPERQNSLATNSNITRARGFQSYHQFGLAADIAFKRNGKLIISERDPWAMQGYQLYGQIAESVGLTWGGRWKSIQDYGHTEYRMPGLKKTAEMAHQLTNEGNLQVNAALPLP
ncbi:M15 family metallopeptidase [Acinetobacter bohemicus]|uniref:M15 family metallopeptidase n=1 Tax=Acinetobacter TaxID=469 RepID=UPI00157C243C|nr:MULTISPECIES: M15 family metallopeptidase [Acinetobacter]MCO8043232.1 M15 family metallopeptidase [Acinetobacter sp. S4400-12]MCU7225579.1 M15 family metallopeptidase [Acinetobacter bohemicus]MDM1782257.1 M15 family metallopeptidase [Acinetobacter indicus]QKQ70103.1 M15 family peptidase [Acinetobacter sp. 10FS3-1]